MIMNHDDDDEPRFYHPHPSHHFFLEPLVIGDSPATGQPPNPPRIPQKHKAAELSDRRHLSPTFVTFVVEKIFCNLEKFQIEHTNY